VEYCIEKLNQKFNCHIKGLKKDALDLLCRYEWPGNVRELMNVLESTYINLPNGKIDKADLPSYIKKKLSENQHLPSDERKRIVHALIETQWNKSTAAKKLNWSRVTLYRKISRHKIVEIRSPR
jgi:transcriptional regulator of acetoin/glycerol metabolism